MVTSSPVPDVHQYCDRWCERCPLSHRCQVSRDALGEIDSAETLCDYLAPCQPSAPTSLDDIARSLRATHPLAVQGRTWYCATNDWLATCFAEDPDDERAQVVAWHAAVALTKIGRAVCGDPDTSTLRLESDAYGSAKVAALSLGKILDVLTLWCARHPVDQRALHLLEQTCELLDAIERTYPGYLKFQRPGFDTGAVPSARYGPRVWLVTP